MGSSYFSNDTIVAIATSLAGDGGVGIIRLSGPNALVATQKIVKKLSNPEPRYLYRIEVQDLNSRETIDDGMAVFFPQGHSFTGEDVVELQLHGGRFLLQTVLRNFVQTGLVRMALPGEFTFRAVRNGKLSLTGAQAVKQVIEAKSALEIEGARKNFSKNRGQDFDEISSSLKTLLVQCELSIDFIDQDVEVVTCNKIKTELTLLQSKLSNLFSQMKNAQRIAQGIKITVIGKPNSGKSTLFNALLAQDRAIVSDLAGTTRDVITEELRLDRYFVRLADTAGIRGSIDKIEMEGVKKAVELIANSDLLIVLLDAKEPDFTIFEENNLLRIKEKVLPVLNKTDLVTNETLQRHKISVKDLIRKDPVAISALQGQGIADLLNAIRNYLDATVDIGAVQFLPTEFQIQMITQCKESLDSALTLIEKSQLQYPELLSASINSSLRALSDLAGETTPDDILEKIFAEFCIGK